MEEKETQATETQAADGEVVTLPLEWVIPVSTPTVLADNMIIQRNDSSKHFVLMLFESKPPVMQADVETLKAMKSVPAYCVGRFAIPFSKMKSFVEALEKNVKKAEEIHGGKLD